VSEELHEYLILCHGSIDDLGMEAAIVNSLKVSCINPTISVTVELEVCLVSDCLSLGVQVTLNPNVIRMGFFHLPWFQLRTRQSLLSCHRRCRRRGWGPTHIKFLEIMLHTSTSCFETVKPSSLRPT
jgi:hypothetical protein